LPHRLSLRLQRDEPDVLPLVGSSVAMRELTAQIELLTLSGSAPVLLIGETGTGKGRLAEHIHARSARSARAFFELNCAAIDPADGGAGLFGVLDAPDGGRGVVDAVRGGTVFIDEVAELPSSLQLRLLHLLEASGTGGEGERDRGGGDAHDHDAVGVIAAASKDLVNEVNAGRFREDLYYRLSVAPVHLPPLRARSREDLSDLITATFNALSMNMSNSPRELGDGVVDCLVAYPWPGNIRELCNAIERGLLVARGEAVLQRAHLSAELRDFGGSGSSYTPRTLMDVERAHIHRALHAHNLNRTHTARELGISRATLIKKIKEYGLARGDTERA
jgi:transcriptional regulator with PAS, ATPase and Fis domain